MVRRSTNDVTDRFREVYADVTPDAVLGLERAVFGSDYGATGWTSPEQADELGGRLELGSDQRLLDLGSGRGWPGLYLSARSGCSVVLVDEPVDALRQALERARRDRMTDQVLAVAAGGDALPLRWGSFDAVVHTDVLC